MAGLLYSLMGVGAVTLVVGIGLIGVLGLARPRRQSRPGASPRRTPGVRAVDRGDADHGRHPVGQQWALCGHAVGRRGSDPAAGLVGEVGDLRPAHFLALHAMQVLPLLGLWLDRSGRGATSTLTATAVIYGALTVAVFAQSLMGMPLVRL